MVHRAVRRRVGRPPHHAPITIGIPALVVGCSRLAGDLEPFYVGFSVGGFELGLLPDGTAGTTGPQPLWGVASAAAEFERLLALGATELEPVTEVGGGIKVAAVKDPFGNRLGIIENPLFKASEVR